ncbi:MAG: NADAR family protein [Bacilli bacterium]|nr:NADAR family protein [Bacilli bacterium]
MSICFYKEFGELGYLATYSNHGFYKDGIFYKTSEHYYQSKKFDDPDVVNRIINAKTPKEASIIGRDRNNKKRENWKEIKKDVMFEAVLYKFLNNEEIKDKLLKTGNEEIIEETTKESYWGCGPNHDGENNYGKILCKVRDYIRNEQEKSKCNR